MTLHYEKQKNTPLNSQRLTALISTTNFLFSCAAHVNYLQFSVKIKFYSNFRNETKSKHKRLTLRHIVYKCEYINHSTCTIKMCSNTSTQLYKKVYWMSTTGPLTVWCLFGEWWLFVMVLIAQTSTNTTKRKQESKYKRSFFSFSLSVCGYLFTSKKVNCSWKFYNNNSRRFTSLIIFFLFYIRNKNRTIIFEVNLTQFGLNIFFRKLFYLKIRILSETWML